MHIVSRVVDQVFPQVHYRYNGHSGGMVCVLLWGCGVLLVCQYGTYLVSKQLQWSGRTYDTRYDITERGVVN